MQLLLKFCVVSFVNSCCMAFNLYFIFRKSGSLSWNIRQTTYLSTSIPIEFKYILAFFRGSILAQWMANFADPTCQFWLVFAGSPFRIFKKVRIILRPKFTNLIFHLPTIYINWLTRKKALKPCLFVTTEKHNENSVIRLQIALKLDWFDWPRSPVYHEKAGSMACLNLRFVYSCDLKFSSKTRFNIAYHSIKHHQVFRPQILNTHVLILHTFHCTRSVPEKYIKWSFMWLVYSRFCHQNKPKFA